MTRPILDESHLHPAIRHVVGQQGSDIVHAVQEAIAADAVVIVGMKQNPFPRKARRLLDARGISYRYLEYGSYFSGYRRRLPLKLWTGWTTFPMIFVKGVLVGGAAELEVLLNNGGLTKLLAAP